MHWRYTPAGGFLGGFAPAKALLKYCVILSSDRQATARQHDIALLERRGHELQQVLQQEANLCVVLRAECSATDGAVQQIQLEMDARQQRIDELSQQLAEERDAFERCCDEQAALLRERACQWGDAESHAHKQHSSQRELQRVRVRLRAYAAEAKWLEKAMPALLSTEREALPEGAAAVLQLTGS